MPPWKTGLIVLSVMISSAIISVVELRKVIGQHRENPDKRPSGDSLRDFGYTTGCASPQSFSTSGWPLQTYKCSSTLRVKHPQNTKNKTYGGDGQYRWQSTGNYYTLSFTRRCKFLNGPLGQSHNSFLYLLFTYRNGSGGNHYWQNHRPCVPELRHFKTVDRFTGPWDSTRTSTGKMGDISNLF